MNIDNNEVKRYFLLANAGKGLFRSGFNLGKNELEDEYCSLKQSLMKMSETELNGLITDRVRLDRYDNLDWYKANDKLEKMGAWPKMKSLDIRLTTGNILDTASAIVDVKDGRTVLQYDDAREMEKRNNALKLFLEKFRLVEDNLDFIYKNFPLILFPGGEVREKDYNNWARKNDYPLCKIFDYDVDDGNSRAVAYALEGILSAPVIIGKYKGR